MQANLNIGDRIYNHGDMANVSHFGTIQAIHAGNYGPRYQVLPDPDSGYDGGPYWIDAYAISPAFKGHGGTRIVTEAAYHAWRNEQLAAMGLSRS